MTLPLPVLNGDPRPEPRAEKGSSFDYDEALQIGEDGKLVGFPDFAEGTSRGMELMLDEHGTAAKLEAALTLPLLGAPVRIVGQKGDRGEAEWLAEALQTPANKGGMSTPLGTVVAQMCGALVHRKAYFEKVYAARTVGGRTGLVYDKLAWRPPATCEPRWEPGTGAFRGFRQAVAPFTQRDTSNADGWVKIEAPYAFVFTHGVRRHPLKGHSELKVAHWAWQTTQKVMWLWLRYLTGQALPLVQVKSQDETAGKKAATHVVALKGSGAIWTPANVDMAVLDRSGGGHAAVEFQNCLRWLDGKATESVLAGFTDLSSSASEGRGSFALSADQSDFFLRARVADAAEMSEQLTAFVAADLIRWNHGPDATNPRIEIGPLVEADVEQAVGLLQNLAGASEARVPDLFVEELLVMVAKRLGMDVDAMRDAARRARLQAQQNAETEQQAQLAGIAAQVGVADRAARAGGADATAPEEPQS